jgi:hypothetical protein
MTIFEQYALLKSKITELETKEEELRTKLLEELEGIKEPVKTAMGSFKVVPLKRWTYTPKVAELEEDFKARKALEQSTGDATFVEQPSLRFTPVKL